MRIVLDLATSWSWNRPPVGIVRTERKFAEFLLGDAGVDVAFCRYDKTVGRHVPIATETVRALLGMNERPAATAGAPAAATGSATDGAIDVAVDGATDGATDGEATGAASDGAMARAAPGTTSTAAAATRVALPVLATAATPPRDPLKLRAKRALKQAGHGLVHRLPEPLRPEAIEALKGGKRLLKGSLSVARGYLALRRWRRAAARGAAAEPADAALPSEPFRFEPGDVYCSMGLDWEYNNVEAVYRERARVGFRTVLFCYDTIPVLFPHLMSFDARQLFARYFVDVAHAADRVVAISETSRRDFLALMRDTGAPQPPVDVVHLGTDLAVPEGSVRAPRALDERGPFVLCVSTVEARKNHEVLYNAWDRLVLAHGESVPTLVIVGMTGWGVADLLFRMRTNPRVKDRIVILDNLADEELAWLYRHCLFTVFPSLYEGWGLPAVESLALGKPCICSTAPAVTEAVQGMGVALDPLDTPAWVAAIETMWRDDAARARAGERLRREFHAETWRRHGERMLAVARATREPSK